MNILENASYISSHTKKVLFAYIAISFKFSNYASFKCYSLFLQHRFSKHYSPHFLHLHLFTLPVLSINLKQNFQSCWKFLQFTGNRNIISLYALKNEYITQLSNIDYVSILSKGVWRRAFFFTNKAWSLISFYNLFTRIICQTILVSY